MGRMMAQPLYWNSYPSNSYTPGYWQTDSTYFNSTDFSVLPAGYIYSTSEANYFSGTGCNNAGNWHTHYYTSRTGFTTTAYFWTCTSGIYRYLSYDKTGIYFGTGRASNYAYSVRCVKDY